MRKEAHPSALEFTALISSKICHDIIGPISAIHNGLEMISDAAAPNACTFGVLRKVSQQLTARLQFMRLAYGASGLNDTPVELSTIKKLISDFFNDGNKHQVTWSGTSTDTLPRIQSKLLLNLLVCAITSIPRGGNIVININEVKNFPNFALTCSGEIIQSPKYLHSFIENANFTEIDAFSIQAYYTLRLANEGGSRVSIKHQPNSIRITTISN